jgi:hypothetical protein
MKPRQAWTLRLLGIIAAGILSRTIHTGSVLIDKYLGDALYAAMIYGILRLTPRRSAGRSAVMAMTIMTAIEFFQLTMIPAHLLKSTHLIVRICARLIGTEFSFLDLLAYAVGILSIHLASQINPAQKPHRYE